jgi:hypothetical protein
MKRWTTYSLLRLLGGGLQPPRPRPRNPLHEIGEAFSGVGLTSVNYGRRAVVSEFASSRPGTHRSATLLWAWRARLHLQSERSHVWNDAQGRFESSG